jgi:hypothetical protein
MLEERTDRSLLQQQLIVWWFDQMMLASWGDYPYVLAAVFLNTYIWK